MRVFLTGATGFIGSHIVPELLQAGHAVLGLTRSEEGAGWLRENGAEPYLGRLEDPEGLAGGARAADAVIHTAFDHDFSRFAQNCEKDRGVIAAIGAALAGSDKPFIITSGTGMGGGHGGEPALETVVDWDHPNPRIASERAGAEALAGGASVAVVRLPQVHDTRKQGLISPYIELAREKALCAYVGDGSNRWPAAHVGDVARLYRLALDRHETGARSHAVAELGIPMRDIAEAVARGLGVPAVSLSREAARAHFGWFDIFAALDMPADSSRIRQRLGWQPTGPTLLADLEKMDYRTDAGG
jgi:nucleoside-diphosphate-sugar epimerase